MTTATETAPEPWRRVFRDGLAPLWTRRQLEVLRDGLRDDDPRLVQGATTVPPPVPGVGDWPCEGACLIGYVGMAADGDKTAQDVNEFFVRTTFDIDARLHEPAGCRWLLQWFDETHRAEMLVEMQAEVELALEGRP